MNDLIDALPGLGFVALAVCVVAVARLAFGDRSGADEHDLSDQHDLSDYHDPAPDRDPTCRYTLHNGKVHRNALPSEPTAPADEPDQSAPAQLATAGRSIFAETAAALGFWPADAGAIVEVVARRYGDSPADVAARMLRELGEQAQTELAVVR